MAGGQFLDLEVDGLKELSDGLSSARKDLGRETRRAHKEVASEVTPVARARAAAESPMARHFAARIQPRATQKFARIAVTSPGIAAIAGAKRRFGWYAADKYAASTGRQFPEWEPGIPKPIDEALAAFGPRIDDLYAAAHERALSKAFPGGMS